MPSQRRATLTDVAQRVGVSAKTVSRVLNGDGPVADGTRAKIMAVVEELGFQPNLMARNMRVGSRDSTVGLVVPDMGNPFFGMLASGIEEAVGSHGLTLLIGSSGESVDRENALVTTFLARRISTLMIVPATGGDHRHLRRERDGGLPLVFLDRPAAGLAADCVISANRQGAKAGTAHLIAHGHRRIACISDLPASLFTRQERFRGYRDALAEAGIPYDRTLATDAHDPVAAATTVRRLLALGSPPTAIFTGNNLATLGAVQALTADSRQDVALVGFDDLPLADVLRPGLTVVTQDPRAIGTAAAELALRGLDGTRRAATRHTVPVRLVPRGTGELSPPGDTV